MTVTMAGMASHGKRAHTDGYFGFGGQAVAAGSSSEPQQEFGRMQSKKPKAATRTATKKSLSAKVKNDRLGDRVAVLRQLVSPFGKSDTASVLQEATGYIKFLHQQLQVLSLPYLRGSVVGGGGGGVPVNAEYCNLRSRGLCTAPVELAQQITQSNGADMWAPAPANSSKRR